MSSQDIMPAGGEDAEQTQPVETIRIVLADDHEVVRTGLRMLLDNEPDFEVVAEASDTDSARRYVRGHHPKVLVLDLNMPAAQVLRLSPRSARSPPKRRSSC